MSDVATITAFLVAVGAFITAVVAIIRSAAERPKLVAETSDLVMRMAENRLRHLEQEVDRLRDHQLDVDTWSDSVISLLGRSLDLLSRAIALIATDGDRTEMLAEEAKLRAESRTLERGRPVLHHASEEVAP
jgi:aromatic ring hydroxylase